MRPLTFDDLLPLAEYASRRRELFDSLRRYQDRYRTVRIGPRVVLQFVNRQTLWFHVQDVLRVARLSEPALVQDQLDLYNRLLPGRDSLQAAFIAETPDGAAPSAELTRWQTLQGADVVFCLGRRERHARLVTCRPEDRCLGAVHWLQFTMDKSARATLADAAEPAFFALRCSHYAERSSPLTDDLRQSLLDDLALSDRDG